MKQKFLIFLVLILLVLLLAGLNAATYVQKEKVPDTEFAPIRSTYNSGSTGTQAFYALLSETGRNVMRWQTSLETLPSETKNRPSVFVMIGPLRRDPTDEEVTKLMEWVASGGTLVLIDREPSAKLAVTTPPWSISVSPSVSPELYVVDAADQKQMTTGKAALKPVLPSSFARGVNGIQPSRFASSITLARSVDQYELKTDDSFGAELPGPAPDDPDADDQSAPGTDFGSSSLDSSADSDENSERSVESTETSAGFDAPLVHVSGSGLNLLVEAPSSAGRIIILSDPYIVSNNGINLVDNAQLAINLVTSRAGLIAFDEYHHGYGANNNRFFQYFEGTPVIAIFLQCALVVAFIFFSQSRRFARPIPESAPSRLSKLEYIAAMAELQQRTRAYDLAVENIYTDFRRRVSALVGLDSTATRKELAHRIAERIRGDEREIEDLLFNCEDIIHGEPVDRRKTVSIIERLRDLEIKLGLKRSVRKGL